jgi:hypothetical protein
MKIRKKTAITKKIKITIFSIVSPTHRVQFGKQKLLKEIELTTIGQLFKRD